MKGEKTMEMKKFIAERDRMCKTFPSNCKGCPIYARITDGRSCNDWTGYHLEEADTIVEKWSREHQLITRIEKMKKAFPDLNDGTTRSICPLDLVKHWDCGVFKTCPTCKHAFWNAPLEEEEEESQCQ